MQHFFKIGVLIFVSQLPFFAHAQLDNASSLRTQGPSYQPPLRPSAIRSLRLGGGVTGFQFSGDDSQQTLTSSTGATDSVSWQGEVGYSASLSTDLYVGSQYLFIETGIGYFNTNFSTTQGVVNHNTVETRTNFSYSMEHLMIPLLARLYVDSWNTSGMFFKLGVAGNYVLDGKYKISEIDRIAGTQRDLVDRSRTKSAKEQDVTEISTLAVVGLGGQFYVTDSQALYLDLSFFQGLQKAIASQDLYYQGALLSLHWGFDL